MASGIALYGNEIEADAPQVWVDLTDEMREDVGEYLFPIDINADESQVLIYGHQRAFGARACDTCGLMALEYDLPNTPCLTI